MSSLSPLEYNERIKKKCPKCDNYIPYASIYCPFCGYYLLEPDSDSGDEPDPSPPRKTISRIVTAALAVAVVIMALYFIILPQTTSNLENQTTFTALTASSTLTPIPTATLTPTPTPTVTPTPSPTPTPVPTELSALETDLTVVKGIRDPSTNDDIYIPGATASSYLWPDADTRYYSESDLEGLTQGQVRYLINEIYARAGYTFRSNIWADYFEKKTWYSATISNEDFNASPKSYLNTYEYQNVEMINNYQVIHKHQQYS